LFLAGKREDLNDVNRKITSGKKESYPSVESKKKARLEKRAQIILTISYEKPMQR
jgi:hypothetical protein